MLYRIAEGRTEYAGVADRAEISNGRSVTFVMPALNEERNIAAAVAEVERAAAVVDEYEIVIVDDGSTDATGAIADQLAARDSRIRVIHNPRNLGFGGAYKVGAAAARMSHVMMVPGDNNHPPDGITPILALLGTADMVVPYISNPEIRGRKRQLISGAYTLLLNILFGYNIPYYNGLVLHRTDLLRTISIETNSYAYQSEAMIKLLRRGATVTTVSVPLAHHDNSTRAFKPKNVMRVLETVWRLFIRRDA